MPEPTRTNAAGVHGGTNAAEVTDDRERRGHGRPGAASPPAVCYSGRGMETSHAQGWRGRLLHVDLSGGPSRAEQIPRELLLAYLGGRGLGVRLLRDAHTLDPLVRGMPLVFAVGPLCGTPAPTAARLAVVSRSPLTGTVSDGSAGGRFAHRLKAAGFDALRIVGRSPRPVALAVTPAGAEILPADSLWGKTVGETVRALEGRGSVAAIGPAGENGVLFAGILMG